MENSVCRNLNDRAVCSCRDGFRALREDNAYCEGNPCNDVYKGEPSLGLVAGEYFFKEVTFTIRIEDAEATM